MAEGRVGESGILDELLKVGYKIGFQNHNPKINRLQQVRLPRERNHSS